eukprot:10937436-Alexandrium_andersonii.AAC.1
MRTAPSPPWSSGRRSWGAAAAGRVPGCRPHAAVRSPRRPKLDSLGRTSKRLPPSTSASSR